MQSGEGGLEVKGYMFLYIYYVGVINTGGYNQERVAWRSRVKCSHMSIMLK